MRQPEGRPDEQAQLSAIYDRTREIATHQIHITQVGIIQQRSTWTPDAQFNVRRWFGVQGGEGRR